MSSPPSTARPPLELRRLVPLELALREEMEVQHLCLDAESLLDSFSPLLKLVEELHGRPGT